MEKDQGKVRCLLAGDDKAQQQRVLGLLDKLGVDCPPTRAVPLELASDRASRLSPDVMILVMNVSGEAGVMRALHEVSNTVRCGRFVVGPASDPQLILRVLHAGADEFVDQARLEENLTEAFLRYRAKSAPRPSSQKTGQVIGVIGASGGVGASTIAVNVGAALARLHGKCAVVDLRLHTGDLAPLLNLIPEYSITDFCENLSRVDSSMFDQFFAKHKSGLQLLAAPHDHRRIEVVTERGVRQVIAMARARFPYIVTDLDNQLAPPQVEAIWQCDVILLALRLDYTSIKNARRLRDRLIEDLGIDPARLQAVASRLGQPKQVSIRQAEKALQLSISHFVQDDPRRVNRCNNQGAPIVLDSPRAHISRNFKTLAASVNGQARTQPQTSEA